MRGVEERSLSSILRSKLLTALINNDVWVKVNAGGCASALDKFDAMQMCFASGSAENKALLTRKSDFLSAERCPVTARPDGTEGNEREAEGMRRRSMRGRSSVG